jgi:hypothetical protein
MHARMHIQGRKGGKGQKIKEGKIKVRKTLYGCVDE